MFIPPFNIGKETPEKYRRKSKSGLYFVCTTYITLVLILILAAQTTSGVP